MYLQYYDLLDLLDLNESNELFVTSNDCLNISSQELQGGKSKPKPKYIPTSKKHTDRSGITRVVYKKDNGKNIFYIKKKSPETNKFAFHKVKV